MARPAADAQDAVVPIAVASLVVVFWGATPVVTKIAAAAIDPIDVGMLRTVLGGLAAAPLALALGIRPPRGRAALGLLLLSGLCGFVVFPLVFTIGQRLTSAMHGGLILAVAPIATGLFAALLERRRPGRSWWLGCMIAFAGEALLIVLRAPADETPASVTGDLLVLAAALLVGFGYVSGARLAQRGYSSLGTTLWGIALGAALLAPLLALRAAQQGWPAGDAPAWGAVLFLAYVTSILGYIGWYWALAAGGIGRTGTIQFFQPVSGLVLASVLLGEQMTLPLGIAAVLILAGVTIAQWRR